MIKINRLTDYAVLLLGSLMEAPEQLATAARLAEESGVPGPTVAKVLKMLAKSGILRAVRGMSGGYALARPAEAISVGDIIAAIDGPIALTDCVDGGHSDCAVERICPMRGNWQRVNQAVRRALDEVSLADMAPDRRKVWPEFGITTGGNEGKAAI